MGGGVKQLTVSSPSRRDGDVRVWKVGAVILPVMLKGYPHSFY